MEKSREIHSKVDTLKKGDTIKISYGSSLSKTNEVELKVRSRNKVRKGTIDKITFENVNNPKGVKFYAYNRGNGWGFAVGDMGISNVNIIDSYAKGGSTYQGGGEIFDISIFNDGVRSKYGEEENLTLEELIESLMYYDVISEKYNEEELLSEIKKIKEFPHNRKDFGDSFMRVSVYKRTQKSKGGSTYAKGGVIVDLFEDYEQQPAQVRAIYDKYEDKIIDGDYDYSDSAEFLKEMQKIGYTFEYGLDNEPYGLRPIGVSLNQLEGYEEYAKGGNVKRSTHSINQDRRRLSQEPHEQSYLSKRTGDYLKFEEGGEIEVDEDGSNLPQELYTLFAEMDLDREGSYDYMEELRVEANEMGYDFDYDLSGTLTHFWKLDDKYAKGGALRNIMKSIKDYAAPFAVIAVDTKKGKVLKQDISIQDYNLIPAHYREMAREFPNAEIRVEDSTGVSMYAKGGSVKSKGYFTGELSFLNW
jgi:hypothetical protein